MSDEGTNCAVCVLDPPMWSGVRKSETSLKGVPLCGQHLRDIRDRDDSKASRHFRALVSNTGLT